ncbi:hypothetical protein V7068_00965 [Bacillus sp. JJ634]
MLYAKTKETITPDCDFMMGVDLFKKHFYLKEVINVCYERNLDQEELINLVQMTPLSWKSKKTDVESFMNCGSSKITIDLDILIGLNKF